jgi:hypothetical protein
VLTTSTIDCGNTHTLRYFSCEAVDFLWFHKHFLTHENCKAICIQLENKLNGVQISYFDT